MPAANFSQPRCFLTIIFFSAFFIKIFQEPPDPSLILQEAEVLHTDLHPEEATAGEAVVSNVDFCPKTFRLIKETVFGQLL